MLANMHRKPGFLYTSQPAVGPPYPNSPYLNSWTPPAWRHRTAAHPGAKNAGKASAGGFNLVMESNFPAHFGRPQLFAGVLLLDPPRLQSRRCNRAVVGI